MKKLSLLSLLLLLLLVFSACQIPELPSPSSPTTTTNNAGGGQKPSIPPYDEDSASYGYYYDQLSGNEKTVYRAICKNADKAENILFTLETPLVISTPISEGEDAHSTAISLAVRALVQPAMDALGYDHPEISWIAYGGAGGSSFSISFKTEEIDGNKVATVECLTFVMQLKAPLTSKEDAAAFDAQMQEAVAEILATLPDESASRYDRLLAAQNALAARIVYDKTAERPHEAAGALLDGRAVCDGYAKSFKILCDAMGIPCVIVGGTATQSGSVEAHAWNLVQMEDGCWYAVDLTWNDVEGESASTNFFLLGSETVPGPGRPSFSESHTPSGKFSAGDYTPFTFPTLSSERYVK